MAKGAASSRLEDLDLSGEEVQRLTSAFQDPEFRRMFSEYAEQLNDPENRRLYEAEITALERERGVDVRFVHPEPGHVLRTSLDGTRRCFVNVCCNALVGAPSCRPGSDRGAPGSHWILPYSLAPAREYAGRSGSRYTVYDVVFHPDALALARRHERLRHMLDDTALEAVQKQFGVRLDRRNAKTLKVKYKGTPEAAVLRTPLPGGAPARPEGDPDDPLLAFPYPYSYPAASGSSAGPRPRAPSPPEPAPPPAPTEPRYSVVQRHHVDLQDYRCSRDSAPSPVPRELVVTIELPLLRSAEQAALEVTGKLLCLDSRKPDYRLRLSLPYPVDDSRGHAQFHKARRQLVVTLPVVPAATAAPEESPGRAGTDDATRASEEEEEEEEEAGLAGGLAVGNGAPDSGRTAADRVPAAGGPEVAPPPAGAGEERDFDGVAGSPPPPGDGDGDPSGPSALGLDGQPPAGGGGVRRPGSGREPGDPAMGGGPCPERRGPVCPPLQCNQDEETLTLLIGVPRIQPQSLRGDVSPLGYHVCFSAQDSAYAFLLQFAPENKLSTREPVISISSDNAVIELAKSPGSYGHWKQWFYGLNDASLEERLFVNEENVDEFLEEVLSSPVGQTVPPNPPLIEVLQVNDKKIQIHAEVQESSNSDKLQGKEDKVNEGSHLTEKENVDHFITRTTDSDSSIAAKALEIDSCGSTATEQESLNASQMLFEKSQKPESKMEPQVFKEMSATYSAEEKDTSKESVINEEKEFRGDHLSSSLTTKAVHNIPDFDSIKEINMQDGSVQIIKDHVTHCAFSFQNSLLYDLD
ncbi:protein kintoun isoform X1 [Oryctolagus cuniculus]|uniref:protein kintoun isoform X1 n=1 Tax=Oryctolagus cuniculus TaxID=9986 RepID=UPI0038790C21